MHTKFPYRPTGDVSLLSGNASYFASVGNVLWVFGHSLCSLFTKLAVLWQKFINILEESVVSSFCPQDVGRKSL
jgi:hypothetical protein